MSINPPSITDIGVLVPSRKVRLTIYGLYVLALIAAGAAGVWFQSTPYVAPEWFGGVNAVLQYLGIPVGALAAANAIPPKLATPALVAQPTPAPAPVVDPATTGGD